MRVKGVKKATEGKWRNCYIIIVYWCDVPIIDYWGDVPIVAANTLPKDKFASRQNKVRGILYRLCFLLTVWQRDPADLFVHTEEGVRLQDDTLYERSSHGVQSSV